MMSLEEIVKHVEHVAYSNNDKALVCMGIKEYRELAVLLRELQERRKQPEFICCGECGHSMYDEDGGLYCDNLNTDIYYTHYDFACNRSERRTDGEKQSD